MDHKAKESFPLKVLHLEDSPQDAEIIREMLTEAGFDLNIDCVATEKKFVSLLHSRKYDIILSDFKLPGFDGFGALRYCLDICPKVPFICVSGTIGEEIAVEFIRRGAVDYILKDRPGRLPSAMKRALEEAKEKEARKKAEEEIQLSAERWQNTFNSITDIVTVISRDHEFLEINDTGCKSLGLSRAEIIGKKCFELVHGLNSPIKACPCTLVFDTKKPEYNEIMENGRHYLLSAWPIFDKNNDVVAFSHAIKDITDRKQAEEALRESEEKHRTLFETMIQGVVYQDADGKIISANSSAERILGLTIDQMQGRTSLDPRWKSIHEDGSDFPGETHPSMIALKTGQPVSNTIMGIFHPKEEETRWIIINAIPLFKTGEKKSYQVYSTFQDVTERKQAEEEVQKYKMAIEYSHESIFITQVDGSIIYVNPAFEHLYGYSADEVIGKTPRVIKSGQLSQEHYQKFWEALQAKQTLAGEIVNKTKDGRLITVYASDNPILDSEEKLVGFMSIQTDITERKQAEEELRTSENQLSIAMEISKLGYWEYDVADDLFTFNDHFYGIFRATAEKVGGYRMPPAQYAERFVHPDDRAVVANEMQKAFETTDPDFSRTLEHRIIYADGELGYISVRFYIVKDEQGRTIKTYGANQDITEQKRQQVEKMELEHQFRESQKMESIGALAGGIAHDFNNLLTVIQGHAQLAMMAMDENNPQYKDLTQIMNSSTRAANLTRQLLLFSRKQAVELKALDLNYTIQNFFQMIKRLIGENIEVDTNLASDLSNVEADEGNIEQVIMNLAVNARDAMPEGGKLTIKTENVVISDNEQIHVPDSRSGNFVRISVQDTGCGISRELLSKIFEPFYSTKELGKGTGLGLSVVFGIIKSHGGWINVYSEPDHGTVFKIYLPASASSTQEENTINTKSKEALYGNGEQILLIEDEKGVLDFASSALRQFGYIVQVASDGKQALSVFEEAKADFRLIISDVILPDINGFDLVTKLTKEYPDIPVLMCSGYTEEQVKQSLTQERGLRFLQKPYSMNALLSEVKNTIRDTRNQ